MENGLSLIERNKSAWLSLCRLHEVSTLYLFGSALSDQFDKNHQSDLDFVVSINPYLDPLEQGEHLLQLWNGLETIFNRPVDLLTEKSLSNPFLIRQIEATKHLLYDRTKAEIFV